MLDGLPTPERSERLEVKNDHSSTAQAQNIHRGAASLSANYNLSHRMLHSLKTEKVSLWKVVLLGKGQA